MSNKIPKSDPTVKLEREVADFSIKIMLKKLVTAMHKRYAEICNI